MDQSATVNRANVSVRANGVAKLDVEAKRTLSILNDADLEREVERFAQQERNRAGLEAKTTHWVETMANAQFSAAERPNITILVSGLTAAHDFLIQGALAGLGYRVTALDCPDNEALRHGKEFGNRGQCNPTYFTVGNLVKYLAKLRDEQGISSADIVQRYVFLTAGACGPCRFGMYATEYRKALRDAGFEGFRVVLFQQTGGFAQATGEEVGLRLDWSFFTSLAKALLAGDVINALGYRIRPFEVVTGATDEAMRVAKQACYDALSGRKSVLYALAKSRKVFASVQVDRTRAKPKVGIIGEFWAMTTEGDGNYQLQRFLESEGAEVDIQLVTAWLLYMIWESRADTKSRKDLRGVDRGRAGLADLGRWGVAKRELTLFAAERATRVVFQVFARAIGLRGYHLPDMDHVAEIAHGHYHNDLRGGEGHMEVGKLIHNVLENKVHLTVSVKPFGCMPSAGVSDGVQSLVAARLPGSLFCAVETSGDGRVNFYSRIQMYLFKAKQAATAELERTCSEQGVTLDEVRSFLERHPRCASALAYPARGSAGTAANLVRQIAPLLRSTPWERGLASAQRATREVLVMARQSPAIVRATAQRAVAALARGGALLREDLNSALEAKAARAQEGGGGAASQGGASRGGASQGAASGSVMRAA